MFKDEIRSIVWEELRQRDLQAVAHLLTPEVIREAAQSAGVRVGTNALNVLRMVWLAISAAMRLDQSMMSVLRFVLTTLGDLECRRGDELVQRHARSMHRRADGKRKKHSPHSGDPACVSEEAFAQARRRLSANFWAALLAALGQRFEAKHRRWTTWKSFRLLALDGTCVTLPNWRRLAQYFGTASNGKGKRTTQARLVMLQLPLVRLPWRYELAPVNEGERTIAARLLKGIRAGDFVLMDRGFWSYGLFWQIQRQSASFAIRRFSCASLKVIRRLADGDYLVDWSPSDRQWKNDYPPSIQLRLIDCQIKGFRSTQLVTNVLDYQQVSRDELIRLSTDKRVEGRIDQGLYHRRWEIETTFFELKVRQGMERSIRSRTPQSLAFEVGGHVLLYFLVRWLIVEAATEHKISDPLSLSFAATMQTLNAMTVPFLAATPQWQQTQLLPKLIERIAAGKTPFRPGRHYPRPNDSKIKNKGGGKFSLPSKLPTTYIQA